MGFPGLPGFRSSGAPPPATAAAVRGVRVVGHLAQLDPERSEHFARRLGGVVRTVVTVRLLSAALLGVIPLMPSFALAGATYLVRMLANAVSVPVRQSYVMGIVRPEERSRMAALPNLPARVVALAGPALAGGMLRTWWIGVPLEVACSLQLVYAGLYWRFFRDVRPPEEMDSAVRDAEGEGEG